ncbi:ATP-binding cassette domain-containing protein, partial [Salmonella enterica]|uniref:ATP-binding cassette domain-containing protein n=1 Tax=Salmonella enterica TaxID=28901 RepID=UPI00398C6EEF
ERRKIETGVAEIGKAGGLDDKGKRFPGQLVAGQKQRVGIARDSANHPDVLLCDEPTSELDLETSATILALLRQINEQLGITILLTPLEMNLIHFIFDSVVVTSAVRLLAPCGEFSSFPHPQPLLPHYLSSSSLYSPL